MNLIGRVEKIETDFAYVEVKPDSACGSVCGACSGCSYKDGRQIKIRNSDYQKGQYLTIYVNSNQALFALIFSAGIILALLIAGYFAGAALFPSPNETPGVIGAICGLLAGALFVKLLEPLWQKIEYRAKPME